MEIEMGKKYKTRDGRDVEILSIDEKYHRAIGLIGDTSKYRSLTIWDIRNREMLWSQDQSMAYLLNLVEVGEDWKIAVKHFENGGNSILLKAHGVICLVEELYEDKGTGLLLLKVETPMDDKLYDIFVHRDSIEIPSLEDCNKFILKK